MNSMADREGWIWFDGEFRPWRDCTVHVLTYTLHYGVGAFEGVRAYRTAEGTALFRLQDHTRRLLNSAKILGMQIPWSESELNEAHKQALVRNSLDQAYLRPMVFYGADGIGLRADRLKTHAIIAAWTWGNYHGEGVAEAGIRAKTASFQRNHVNSTMARAKANGNYVSCMLAVNEVLRDGYDEAIMLDTSGHVSEASVENIFLVRDGELHTPELDACLDGITRRSVISLAQDRGIKVTERRITRDELYCCDELFLTGTAAEVLPVREVDNRTVGQGQRGPVTHLLQADYLAAVRGENERHLDWLTYV